MTYHLLSIICDDCKKACANKRG